jgi:hypothetical protein
MTVTADTKKRVVLPTANPGDRFDVKVRGHGGFLLTLLEPARPRVRLVRERGTGLLLGVSEPHITWAETRKAMDEFP